MLNIRSFTVLDMDGSFYFRASATSSWVLIDGDNSWTFIDVNINGLIYAIRDDHCAFSRDYVTGSWIDLGKKFTTLRVLDDNTVWPNVYYDNPDGSRNSYEGGLLYHRLSNGNWEKPDLDYGALYTLWGPTTLPLGLGL